MAGLNLRGCLCVCGLVRAESWVGLTVVVIACVWLNILWLAYTLCDTVQMCLSLQPKLEAVHRGGCDSGCCFVSLPVLSLSSTHLSVLTGSRGEEQSGIRALSC